jgi:membrane fusion protein (multidrug efflux system)
VARSEYASTKAQSQLIKAQIAKQQFVLRKKSDLDLYLRTYITPVMPVANLVNTGTKDYLFYPEKVCQSSKDQYCIEIWCFRYN